MKSAYERLTGWVAAVMAWWNSTRIGRALKRYGAAAGGLLAGGVAYSAAFSLFAGLVIGYTVLIRVVGGHIELRNRALGLVDQYVPGLVDTGNGGVLTPSQLLLEKGSAVATVIAGAVLLWSAISFMGGLRTAVQTVMHAEPVSENFLIAKAKDLGGYVILAVAVIVSAGVSIAIAAAQSWIQEHLGTAAGPGATAAGVLFGLLIDVAVFLYVLRVMGKYRGARRPLFASAVAVSAVVETLRILGTQVITGSISKNALLASFAVMITLLMLVNLLTQTVLYAAAWLSEDDSGRIADSAQATR
ncbi:YihY/virulence factor BrkB family protein [Rarobacter incanus]|uniref:Membrane protein n=1 Tax=Rarobacter incanus TaxID=153494 RepID=A0A542SNA6_9MICO|nr:YhjD/YihY/BrkB family envelope integrity protein [Rarobacter incanus]TQK76103.1 membrane protein [Rarobacter incanus]